MEFFLPIDKPANLTSHRLVLKVRKIVNGDKSLPKLKVGHTGTLDMAATGLMILPVGKATRATNIFQGLDKIYTATALLGQATDTYDSQGKIVEDRDWTHVTKEAIQKALENFRGTYDQIPPPYSAKKIGGRKAYRLAQKGEDVVLKPKTITVYTLDLERVELPFVAIKMHCTSGTYVRSLVKELGDFLGCGAHVCALRRHKIGPFSLDEACTLEDLEEKSREDVKALGIPFDEAMKRLEEG